MSYDPPPTPARSALMAKVRGENTQPELVVRRLTHRLGFRFTLRNRTLPGKPDICFPRLRRAIFVHGCFWHRHRGCRRATSPKTRVEFWRKKFRENVARDRRVMKSLNDLGWTCLVVWECETANSEVLRQRLQLFLSRDDLGLVAQAPEKLMRHL